MTSVDKRANALEDDRHFPDKDHIDCRVFARIYNFDVRQVTNDLIGRQTTQRKLRPYARKKKPKYVAGMNNRFFMKFTTLNYLIVGTFYRNRTYAFTAQLVRRE
jgi:hypothetical protein